MDTNLKRLRVKNGLTQKDVASKIFVSYQYYGRLENGKNELSYTQLITLADFYHVSIDYLLNHVKNKDELTLKLNKDEADEILKSLKILINKIEESIKWQQQTKF